MLEKVGSYEAKTKLPELLRRTAQGESITITNRGKPIADLIPSRSNDRVKAKNAIDNILKATKHVISDDDLKELIESGRK